MNYRVVKKDNKKYINYTSCETKICSEQDVLDLISICFENNSDILILHVETVSEDFFNLKTRLAGTMLQKFMNYNIKLAIILDNEEKFNDRFKEMIIEANKGNHFRIFKNISEAESWILSL
ncbi:hypothetical protein CLPU_14c00490 [Gottschalkia purinilytica]|uniref:DUF4180 domain-containing protein n=1 Tax=Gottschalkia purinilytica TaxID=1503 RepID=A0A0L0W859_GOTPU|nr:DUF4180 domain-containing protein [Gottschalkia purinilytica]KNF07631.1 hypothetical protein CLPU_14c00490 [Gottschalkia purinilytica]